MLLSYHDDRNPRATGITAATVPTIIDMIPRARSTPTKADVGLSVQRGSFKFDYGCLKQVRFETHIRNVYKCDFGKVNFVSVISHLFSS